MFASFFITPTTLILTPDINNCLFTAGREGDGTDCIFEGDVEGGGATFLAGSTLVNLEMVVCGAVGGLGGEVVGYSCLAVKKATREDAGV